MAAVLSPTRLFTGDRILAGAAVSMSGGRVDAILPEPPPDAVKIEGLLAPGFVDVQVNGGGGVLFNDAPTVETLQIIAGAHRRFGVTGFMATLISDEPQKVAQALDAVSSAIDTVDGLLGLHLEGPWLSAPKRGVHVERHLRDFAAGDLDLLCRARAFPLLVTVAPERIDRASITALADARVIVSLGHTAASAEDVQEAFSAGARGVTHLFNAMPPIEARKPGPAGAALDCEACWAGIILDGVHVHPVAARLALARKGAERLMLVSDAMATVGSESASMSLLGDKVTLSGGALRTADGTLAGAHLELSTAVRNAIAMLGAGTEDALRMASLTPAEFLGVGHERGRIAPGYRADFVLLDEEMRVASTWIAGRRFGD